MRNEANDLDAARLAKRVAERQRAHEILGATAALHRTFAGLAVAASCGVTGYLLDAASAPRPLVWVAVAGVAGLVAAGCEQYRQGRRIDALVTLARLDAAQAVEA